MQSFALLLTLFVEGIIVVFLLRRQIPSYKRLLVLGIAPTLITHPFLWSATIMVQRYLSYGWTVFGLETIVVFIEGFIIAFIARISFRHSLTTSALANVCSTAVGLGIWRLIRAFS